MSENGFEEPYSDEPTPEVYRKRRIVAMLIALVILLLIIWGAVALFRPAPEGETASTAGATTSTEPFSDFSARSSSASASPSETAESSETGTATPSESAPAETEGTAQTTETAQATEEATPQESAQVEPVSCTSADMQISLSLDQNSYTAGQNPAIAVTYTNTSGDPCTVGETGQHNVDINITSGPAQVYNYSMCRQPEGEAAELAAGASETKVITWDRSINALGCGGNQSIQPGYYWVTATVNGVPSQPTRIIVTG